MRRSRTRTALILVLICAILAVPHAAEAQAINDPVAFWNALKVAITGGSATLVNGAVRWTVAGFTGGGWAVSGATVIGVAGLGYIAWQLWKAAHTQGANWEGFASGSFGQFYWNNSLPCYWTGYSWAYQISSNPDSGTNYGTGIHGGYSSQADCRAALNANAPGWYAAWRSAVQGMGYNPPAGPTSAAVWPGTNVAVPATIEEAVADARWSTVEAQVAAELPQALEDRRTALGGAYLGRLENYAGSSSYDTTFSNPQAVAQPGNPALPQPGDANAPASAGYLRDLISWLGDVWRQQTAWLAGIIETWQGRVVTELGKVTEAVQALPAAIQSAVTTAVTNAVSAAFTPSQAALDAWAAVPAVAATKPPWSLLPPASMFPVVAGASCQLAAIEIGSISSWAPSNVRIEWPPFVCTLAGYIRTFILGMLWISLAVFFMNKVIPQLSL
jgi:hypothetical protein